MLSAQERVKQARRPDNGYVFFIADDKKLGAVKVVGSRKYIVTYLDIMAWFKTDRLAAELSKVYHELREFRIQSNWYVRDAVEMYLDNRQGRA